MEGRASDKCVVNDYRFLELINLGAAVMADKGIRIEEELIVDG